MGFYKYSLTDLVGSAPRVLIAPSSWTLPVTSGVPTVQLGNVIDLFGPTYAPKSSWIDLGGARAGSGAEYERGLETTEWNLEQADGAVAEDISDIPRTITANISEYTVANVRDLIENAPAERTITGASGVTAQKAVDFGNFESLGRWRVIVIGQGRKNVGVDITEAANASNVRGPFKGVMLFSASLSAQAATVTVEKGQPAVSAVQFRSFPESTVTDTSRNRGTWLMEQGPATLAA